MVLKITCTNSEGKSSIRQFTKSEITIGRGAQNDIMLIGDQISNRHARLVQKDGRTYVVDLCSANGTFVNGKKIQSPWVISEKDEIIIGSYILQIGDRSPSPPAQNSGRINCPRCGGILSFKQLADYCVTCKVIY